jgi:hypothetical protein
VLTYPSDRLLTTNLINRTATVEVPVSASVNDETQVHFFNIAQRAQLKVCKALGPGSADLVGKSFDFVASGTNGQTSTFSITAGATTQCKIAGVWPIGTTVGVGELLDRNPGGPGEFIDVTGEGDVTLAAGINTVTITNTARGLLEVCKARVDFGLRSTATQPTFRFRIDGGAPFNVQAGKCSPPKRVSVGNHTVTEAGSTTYLANVDPYELDPTAPGGGITAFPADREVNKNLNTRTITVSVPYGPNGETLVTFYNRIKLARLKVCKVIPVTSQDALGGKDFSYNVLDSGGGLITTLGPIKPGECTAFTEPTPILGPDGGPVFRYILETSTVVNYTVTNATCTGCLVFGWSGGPLSALYLGPGLNVVTYTNTALDP